MCIFTVAVYGADELDSQYQLTARHPISHIILKESETHRSYIELGDKEYYKFTVNDDHNITQIIFKVTAISGDIDVYISNSDKIKHPNISNCYEFGFAEVDTFKFDKAHNPKLRGNYYISVEANSVSDYKIQVKVYRQDHTGNVSTLRRNLYYGIPEIGDLYFNISESFTFQSRSNTTMTNIFFYYHEYDMVSRQKVNREITPTLAVSYYYKGVQQTEPVEILGRYNNFDFEFLHIKTNHVADDDEYVITVNHQDAYYQDIYLKYSLLINSDDVYEVIPEIGYISQQRLGDTQRYELYLTQDSQIYLELF